MRHPLPIGSVVIVAFKQSDGLVPVWIDPQGQAGTNGFGVAAVVVASKAHAWGSMYLCVAASADDSFFLAQWFHGHEVSACPGGPT